MRISQRIILVAGTLALLPACAGNMIASRQAPDEFAVQRQSPLVIPPDFQLVPPAPGAPRPGDSTASQQALEALFPPQARSSVETVTLGRAGTAEGGIRSTVGDAGTYVVNKGTTTRTILVAPEGDGQAARATI
jgi:hypothetical protein